MQSAEMEPGEDHETTKRRLKKALSVAEKLKKDAQLEHEVNIELARRNDILKKEVESVEHRLAAAKSAMSGLEHSIKQLGGVVGKNDFSPFLCSVALTINPLRCYQTQ
jgi:chromosome segregation ATPase